MAEHDDPDAPPTPEELVAAEALRAALQDPSRANTDADLARALALAHAPRPIDAAAHRAILERALASAPAVKRRAELARGRMIRGVFGAGAGVVALAATLMLFVQSRSAPMATEATDLAPRAAQAKARSTAALFDEPFARGGASARIDRIARARATDLRENHFRRWGVK